jgi:UDP-2,3-diacylglucosamine hydrolase
MPAAPSGRPAADAAVLTAPAHWRSIEFISDLHLCAELPRTARALLDHLQRSRADAVCLLGDIFEAWVGDDMAEARPDTTDAAARFEVDFSLALRDAARRRWIGFMPGNRDFLVGPRWLAQVGLQALHDPTLLVFGPRRVLLSHGDRLCLADIDYQRYRTQVRGPAWQGAFLARPLAERLALARQMRQASQARHQATARTAGPQTSAGDPLAGLDADVDPNAARAWLQETNATTLLHGHTHRPGRHLLASAPVELERLVLSDWDLDHAVPPRAEVLRLDADGWQRLPPLGPA